MIREGTSDRKAIEEVWDRGTYERPRLGFRVEPGELWLDGGANIGAFSRLVTESGAACVSYEPEPLAATLLSRNAPRADLRRRCLTANGGDVTLHVQPKPLQQRRHSLHFARRGSSSIVVPSDSFQSVIDSVRPDGVKLNVEGEEIAILLSRPRLGSVRKLVFEWSFDVDNRGETLLEVLGWLATHFGSVKTSLKVAPGKWRWYPPNVFVFAWNRVS